ncbi:MAG: hypothetical protein DDT31_00702 [Syntrophomonadaceae bacterium]|nr:hypothetical protein [Bacillota bacterium]
MSITNTAPLAAAALAVLQAEAAFTSAVALRISATALRNALITAQSAYEREVILRTPGAFGAISPLTVTAPMPRNTPYTL